MVYRPDSATVDVQLRPGQHPGHCTLQWRKYNHTLHQMCSIVLRHDPAWSLHSYRHICVLWLRPILHRRHLHRLPNLPLRHVRLRQHHGLPPMPRQHVQRRRRQRVHGLSGEYGRGGGGFCMHAKRWFLSHSQCLWDHQFLCSWDIHTVCEIHVWHQQHPVPPGSDSPGPCCGRRRFWFKPAWWRWWRRGPDPFHCYAGRQYSIHCDSGDWRGCSLNKWCNW